MGNHGGKPWWNINKKAVGPPLEPRLRHPRPGRTLVKCRNCAKPVLWLARAEDKNRLVPVDAVTPDGKLRWDGNPYYTPGHDTYHFCGTTLEKVEKARERFARKVAEKAQASDQTNIDNWFDDKE